MKTKIALLTQTATAWGQQILKGVADYSKKQCPWRILHEHGRGTRETFCMPAQWQVDGIIVSLNQPDFLECVQAYSVPTVNLSSVHLDGANSFPRVCEDVGGIAKMAVFHFVDLGFKHFAYYGNACDELYTSAREAFQKVVKENKGNFSSYPAGEQPYGIRDAERDTIGLTEWLESLAKPVCIFTWNRNSATELSEACHKLNLLIPEQVSLLSVGAVNDPVFEIMDPPLSCVAIDATEIGYKAAQLLDTMIQQNREQGGTLRSPPEPILVSPVGVDVRQSSETLAIENEYVALAVAFIRSHALTPITVADVIKHVAISRPRIETLFRQHLNRSPAEEIRRIRLMRAEELLRETNLSIPEVAEASGFTSPEYLARVFKATKGVTPLRYRKG